MLRYAEEIEEHITVRGEQNFYSDRSTQLVRTVGVN